MRLKELENKNFEGVEMMAEFTAEGWPELAAIFSGRLLRGERGTNVIKSPNWNLFSTGDTVTMEELENVDGESPAFNLGIRTGRGLVVVDIDKPDKEPLIRGVVGHSNFEVNTPRGKHLYFRTDPAAKIPSRIMSGVDIFHSPSGDSSKGSYVVAPGSVRTVDQDLKLKTYGIERATYDLVVFDGVDDFEDIAYRDPDVIFELMRTLGKSGTVFEGLVPVGTNIFDVSDAKIPHDGSPVGENCGRNQAATSLVGQFISAGDDFDKAWRKVNDWNDKNPVPLDAKELHKVTTSVFKTHFKNHPEDEPIQPVIDPIRLKKPKTVISALPAKLHTIPGILGDFVSWYMETAPAPHTEMAVQAALALGSVVLGRKYVTTESNFTSLYFLTVAKSGTGKEYGKKAIEKILDSAGLDDLIGGSGYTSPGAVYSELRDRPTHITVIDEFGKYLQACSASGNSQLQEAVTTLVEAFGRLDGTLRPRAYSSMGLTEKQRGDVERLKVTRPAITLYSMTTPKQFYSAIGEADIEAGMLGRFLVVNSPAECGARKRGQTKAAPPAGVVRWAQSMRDAGGGNLAGVEVHDVAPKTVELEFTPAAYEVLDAFEAETVKRRRKLANSGMDVLLARSVEIAMRLAAIVACSKTSPRIDREAMEWAVTYSEHAFNGLVEAVGTQMTGSEFGARRQAVLDAVLAADERGMTEREIKRRFRNLKPKEHAEVVRALVDAGEIALVEMQTKGRKRVAFVALEDEV